MVSQVVINLSKFYLRSVLFHISHVNALFSLDHFISVRLVKYDLFFASSHQGLDRTIHSSADVPDPA